MTNLNNNKAKLASYVGFAIKAGKVKWGVDNIIDKKGKPFLILKDKTLSESSAKKLAIYAQSNSVDLMECEGLDEITARKAKAIGINEPNLAAAIKKIFKGD
ncbi:MAG: hypothetical protein ACOYIQ_01875 [Christensenellales bacterium]|jgi:hypothetical protein